MILPRKLSNTLKNTRYLRGNMEKEETGKDIGVTSFEKAREEQNLKFGQMEQCQMEPIDKLPSVNRIR